MSRKPKSIPANQSTLVFRLTPLSACIRAAITGSVLVGSVSPTYAELPIPGEILATMGVANQQVVGDTMHIDQQTDKAILNWEKFNIGPTNQVEFHQPNASSIALNRIHDANASQILGRLTANGQVYLYNKNGFVFGKDSTVDVNTLVTSTLNITDEVFARGMVRQFDDTGKAALSASEKPDINPGEVGIRIDPGASIHIGKNGRLIMAAPQISNAGSITADEQGQIMLVASKDKVYLQQADSKGPFFGLLVEVGSGGKVENLGNILARQGNVTLAGFAVNQNGRVSATTSVNVNGSIRLLAQEAAKKENQVLVATKTTRNKPLTDGLGTESTVTFGNGSVTSIVADSSGGSAIDEQAQPASYLEVSGNKIQMQSGSAIVAPGGKVNMTATNNLLDPIKGDKGQIQLNNGSLIDVSGNKHIIASIDRNVVNVDVQSYELRDAPLQKGGVLQGKTIQVDLRNPPSIVDTSGAQARFKRSLDERLGTGGDINLTASGEVAVSDGAVVNISGGTIDYQDGFINTTKLVTDYGKVVDIANADPNEHFTSIYGIAEEVHLKFGVTEVFHNTGLFGRGQFQPGYTQGLAAGNINIVAPRLSWRGELIAGAVNSSYQRRLDDRALGGSFALDSTIFNSTQSVLFQAEKNPIETLIGSKTGKGKISKPADLIFPVALTNDSGLQKLSIKTLSDVTVAADAHIAMQAGGQLILDAGKISIQGQIDSANGLIELTSRNTGIPQQSGTLDLAAGSALNTSGRWVNDYALGLNAIPSEALAINGGTIKLSANGDLNLAAGSSLHSDSGAWLSTTNRLSSGKAGSIDLATVARSDSQSTQLLLNGQLSAYGVTTGGSLSLSSGDIVVGQVDAAMLNKALVLTEQNGVLDIAKPLGFSQLQLTSTTGDVIVTPGTTLNLVQQNLEISGDARQHASADSILGLSHPVTLPDFSRLPVNLNLNAVKNVQLQTGSQLLADPQATINLATTVGGIYVNGLIDAPAGAISLSTKADPSIEYNAAQAIWLGAQGSLLATGAIRPNPPDALGRHLGQVLSGGTIRINAQRGYLVTEQGSIMDVSGTRAVLDLADRNNVANLFGTPSEIASDAGKITLIAAEGGILDGQMRGHSGNSSTLGASVDLSLDRSARNPPDPAIIPFPNGDLQIEVVQSKTVELSPSLHFGDVIPDTNNGQLTLSADQLIDGGIDNIRLASNQAIRFSGDVNLKTRSSIELDAPRLFWTSLNEQDNGTVHFDTTHLQMGSSLVRDISDPPVSGAGQFSAHAQWIDLRGASQWNGFAQITLNSDHDLRTTGLVDINPEQRNFVGGLLTAANLQLTASQIYPTTLSQFSFSVRNNPEGRIEIKPSGFIDSSPLAAAGVLNFQAPIIHQGGILKAAFGHINLHADSQLTLGANSLTSVSGAGLRVPFGLIQGGFDWLYPLDSNHNLVFNAPPEKQLQLSAPSIALAAQSVVDLSGGGDLSAYEFLPGSGGSYDYLEPSSRSYLGGFAVVPGLNAEIAPYDPLQSNTFTMAFGSRIHLTGSGDLPTGDYTILPPHYALMPGAYLVTPQANSQDMLTTSHNRAGLPIVPGYQFLAGTGTREARWSGYLLESGTDIRKHSEYDEKTANLFYPEQARKNETAVPVLPNDSGQISLVAQDQLTLQGQFKVASQGNRGARMDIAANRLKIVEQLSTANTDGSLQILADDLNQLGVDSLLLGGGRSNQNDGSTNLTISSSEVIFDEHVKLTVPDLTAIATDKVEVRRGATLAAVGQVHSGDTVFKVDGDSALLRISAGKPVNLLRTGTQGNLGDLSIQPGATLAASQAMLLDASHSTTLDGDIQMQGGSLKLNANAINLGEINSASSNGALNLSNSQLQSLAVDELELTSRDTVNFYGNVGQPDGNGQLKPIHFDRLLIDAPGFSGFANNTQQAMLQANHLRLQNTQQANSSSTASGQGQLMLSATHYTQGSGHFAIQGFSATHWNIAEDFTADGNGILSVDGALSLATGYLTATGGKQLTIDAGIHPITVTGNEQILVPSIHALGGTINLMAGSIDFNAGAFMPSGSLSLQSVTGDVAIGNTANIDLAGQAVGFADTADYTPGGHFTVVADHGKITTANGSRIDLSSGGGSAKGGKITLRAKEQSLAWSSQLQASSGSALIEIADFADGSHFDQLMDALIQAGVSDSIYFRSHQADIVQSSGQTIQANDLTLVSDRGAISLSGKLDANGHDEGGAIHLYAGDRITLEAGAQLSATGNQGGKIMLSAIDADADNTSGINIKTGSVIDVSGATPETGGVVNLQALRTGNGIAIAPIAGTVRGYAQKSTGDGQFYAEGVKRYQNSDFSVAGEINSDDINRIKADTDSYMSASNQQQINAELGAEVRLKAGIAIDYTGDLQLNSPWDLVDWRYDTAHALQSPGTLTIASSGDLTLNHSLSDGFKNGSLYFGTVHITDQLQTGASWSYQLTAGADLSSSDPAATLTSSNLTIGSGVAVRTGTGDITLTAGGDVLLTDQTSTVYNAGRADDSNRYGLLDDVTVAFKLYAEYPIDGGELRIDAGKDIIGAVSNQFISAWLPRIGNWSNNPTHDNEQRTAWGVALGYTTDGYGNASDANAPLFQQNIGSFAGGRVSIRAAGNINDLSVMMPTTGKPVAGNQPDQIVEQILGGGQMRVSAGADIHGGAYLLGKGQGELSAGGVIAGSDRQFVNGPQLAIGDTQMSLNAKNGIQLSGVSDPMILHSGNAYATDGSIFFSYGNNSGIALRSLSGDVHLGADTGVMGNPEMLNLLDSQDSLAKIYPGSLQATAFSGSVLLDNQLTLFPSDTADLTVLADQDIRSSADVVRLGLSDADRALLPTAEFPLSRNQLSDAEFILNPFGINNLVHAATPLHSHDPQPVRLVTHNGDIAAIQLNLPKSAIIESGRDLNNVLINIQQINNADASIIAAARDIRYISERSVDGLLKDNPNEIRISGPGQVLIKSGRNMDLGASPGLSTVGNLTNPNLSTPVGAGITVIAGLNKQLPNYAGFFDVVRYAENYLAYKQAVTQFMRLRDANPQLTEAEALNAYRLLTADQQAPLKPALQGLLSASYAKSMEQIKTLITPFMRKRLANPDLTDDSALAAFANLDGDNSLPIQSALTGIVNQVFFNELKRSGTAAAKTGAAANDSGFAVIEALFPNNHWQGDLSLFFSKLQTLQGGDINLLVPGGEINAGLAVSFSGAKEASELGIVAQGEGNINAFVRDDFIVNQSRVFALSGGDILIWSSEGDIDAGRGAKSSLSAPKPESSVDENGNLVVTFPPVVSGSGIRTAATAGSTPGDVYLFAPKGVVNAGEAGIGGTNVTISATAVLGANNIQIGGIATGVPAASTGSLGASLSGVSNLSASVSQMAQATAGMSKNDGESGSKNTKLGVLSVDVIGYGDKSVNAQDRYKKSR